MKLLREIFSDGKNLSCMRIMAFMSLCTGIFIALQSLRLGADISSTYKLCGVFIGGAFGGKAIQSFTE